MERRRREGGGYGTWYMVTVCGYSKWYMVIMVHGIWLWYMVMGWYMAMAMWHLIYLYHMRLRIDRHLIGMNLKLRRAQRLFMW